MVPGDPRRTPLRASATSCWTLIFRWRPARRRSICVGPSALMATGPRPPRWKPRSRRRAGCNPCASVWAEACRATLAFNRRGIRRDGTIFMPRPLGRDRQPFGISDVCYLEGPIDPEVGVCCVQDMDSKPMAFLLHYTCHPGQCLRKQRDLPGRVGGLARAPGPWRRSRRSVPDAVPLVVNGCCGNINPWHPYDADFRPEPPADGARIVLSERTYRAEHAFASEAVLDTRIERIGLPFREIPDGRLREVAAILDEHPKPPRQADGQVDPATGSGRHRPAGVELCRRRDGAFSYEIQAFRIGDLCIVGLPGEPFVEGATGAQGQFRGALSISGTPHDALCRLPAYAGGLSPRRTRGQRGRHLLGQARPRLPRNRDRAGAVHGTRAVLIVARIVKLPGGRVVALPRQRITAQSRCRVIA